MSQALTIVHTRQEASDPRKVTQRQTAGEQAPGVAMSTGTLRTYTAGATAISGQRVLMTIDSAGTVAHCDPTSAGNAARIVGISKGAAYAHAEVMAQWDDVMTDPGFAWDLTKRIFCGLGGILTQTPPATGFSRCVGQPITPTSMRVEIDPPINLVA